MTPKTISTVVTPAASYDLTTLDVIKDELSISDGSKDTTLRRYLSWASAALSQACNRIFPVETVTDEVWPERSTWSLPSAMEIFQLSRWPLVSGSVSSVTENGVVLVDGTDFRIDYARGQLIRLDINGALRHWAALPLAATFGGGFSTIPGDLADAVTRMTRNRFRSTGRDSYLMSENIPGIRDARWWIATGNEAGNVPPDVEDLIENYRVPVIA